MPKFSARLIDAIQSRIQSNWEATFAANAASDFPGALDTDELARYTTIDWTRQFLRDDIGDALLAQQDYILPLFLLNVRSAASNPNGPNRGIMFAGLVDVTVKIRWTTNANIEPVTISTRANAIQSLIESTLMKIMFNPATRSNYGPGISFNSQVAYQLGTLQLGDNGYLATESYTFTFAIAV